MRRLSISNSDKATAIASSNHLARNTGLTFGLWLLAALALFLSTLRVQAVEVPQRLIDNHRATMGCWLADIDDDELKDRAIVISLGVQTLYGFICSSSLSGDSFRLYQVEDGRNEWANLLSFPQLDTKLGWYATSLLQKPTWDEKNKLLRSEVPKKGTASSCRQFSIFAWEKGRFHIAQIGLSGDCEENMDGKDLIIYPIVEEVEKGEASGLVDDGDETAEDETPSESKSDDAKQ
ncbi:hypothetical protein SAMN04515647_1746 [Cohaesibacter sp. ES.047]|uniref:hypothetical protein n=1 Tax=Cohaesibacter sp. ES.047 TaxID=1798205 RepID=UPI000BB68E9E|nr:hypothetical protein [Cohaesibacter sp. ES.047]SNY91518.1 hypothetical protein SAMN04515647_1746 [Cohaesibacter sp. ES.047]